MKKFNINGIEKIEESQQINESFGTLILGLLTVLGITLSAAIKTCRDYYDDQPEEDPAKLRDLDTRGNAGNDGTKRTFDEVGQTIDNELGNKDKDKEGDKEGDKSGDKDDKNASEKSGDKSKDGDKPTEDEYRPGLIPVQPPLADQDPKDPRTKAKADLKRVLITFDEALKDGQHKAKIDVLFDYVLNSGAAKKAQEDNPNINKDSRLTDVNYILSRSVVKFQQILLSKDPKYNDLFKDVNYMKGIQELICMSLIFNNERKSFKLKDGIYANIASLLES